MPLFNGKGQWSHFWIQFQRVSRRNAWDDETALDRLVCCLRDDALVFFGDQAAYVQESLPQTVLALGRRFDERKLPQTYRALLQTIKRERNESLKVYASR